MEDAEKWKQIGLANADLRLGDFDGIAAGLQAASARNKKALTTELKELFRQVRDATDNNLKVANAIEKVIKSFQFLVRGNPLLIRKLGLKSVTRLLDGKRDNKSYYLLDGSRIWLEKRIEVLAKYDTSEAAKALQTEFEEILAEVIKVRDMLEERAQAFVANLKRLHVLSGDDVGRHLDQLKETADEMGKSNDTKEEFETASIELKKDAALLVRKHS